jgi:hypothetical protein
MPASAFSAESLRGQSWRHGPACRWPARGRDWPVAPCDRERRRACAVEGVLGWQAGPAIRWLRARKGNVTWARLDGVGPFSWFCFILFIFYSFSFLSIFKPKFEFKLKLITTTYVCGIKGINSGYIYLYILFIFFISFFFFSFPKP